MDVVCMETQGRGVSERAVGRMNRHQKKELEVSVDTYVQERSKQMAVVEMYSYLAVMKIDWEVEILKRVSIYTYM